MLVYARRSSSVPKSASTTAPVEQSMKLLIEGIRGIQGIGLPIGLPRPLALEGLLRLGIGFRVQNCGYQTV